MDQYHAITEVVSSNRWYIQIYRNDYWIASMYFRFFWMAKIWMRWTKWQDQRYQEKQREHAAIGRQRIDL